MSVLQASVKHRFVLPPLDGPNTGGTLYNRELCKALRQIGDEVRVLELGAPGLQRVLGVAQSAWVDSLYLAAFPELKQRASGKLGLILHYLPSFVALGRPASHVELPAEERRALASADALLVTSNFMRDALEALVAPSKMLFVVEPGTCAERSGLHAVESPVLRVIVVGNVVPGKGIEPWLRVLDAALCASDPLHVSIVGSLAGEPEYAERCLRLVQSSPSLAERVAFLGPLSHQDTLAAVARADLFVSASRMESYGMALAEANALGIPILARAAGNAAAHVDPEAGGQLVADDPELARACVALARDAMLRRERLARARARRPLARSWLDAARAFKAQLAEWEK